MYKNVVSLVLSAVLVMGNLNGMNVGGDEQKVEGATGILDVAEEEELEWVRIGDVAYMPEGITRIEASELSGFGGDNTIEEFQGVKKLVLPSTLEYIGDFAFEMCELEEIVISENVKEIGNDAFWACNNLKKVVFEGDYVEKMGRALFRGCDNLETVILPKSVKEWNTECTFYNCNIKNITLPEEGMTTLGSGMFGGCPLEELIIPDCVTTMNYGVFIGCENLKLVKAGYNVVNFEQGEEYYDLYNFTLGCFGIGCSNMVLEAPLDSAIVEYARDYRYFTVKYDYPDFERVEWICDGKIPEDGNVYPNIIFEHKVYPETARIGGITQKALTKNVLQEDGFSNLMIWSDRIEVDLDTEWTRGVPAIHYFSETYTTQDENLEYTVKHTDYFRIVITKDSVAERRVQIEILTAGTWDGEDAQWELITPAIDTSILTPTPVPTKEVTPEPEKVTTEVPKVTEGVVQPTSKPAVTVKATPTPEKKTVKPAKVNLKPAKQLTTKKHGKKVYTKAVKVSWKKTKNADGYVIYMKSGKGKYKVVKNITNGKTVSYTKKNLKKGKTYYFKVRAYRKENGQKVYGNYSGVKKIKIK